MMMKPVLPARFLHNGVDDGDDDVQAPPDGGYGGGPTDLTLLYSYHKHRANQIWTTRNFEDKVYTK
jgi:hypothetical protein